MKKKRKVKPPIKRAPKKAEPEAENKRHPFCRICNHHHPGVEHVWK